MDFSVPLTASPNSFLSSVIRENFGNTIFAIASTKTPTIIVYRLFAYSSAETPSSPFTALPPESCEAKRVFTIKLIG